MDKKIGAWWSAHKLTKRRLIQVYAALLYNANLKGFIEGQIYTGPTKNLCVPGFNCYSCPGAVGACPLGALQNALASSGNRAPYYVLGILMLFGLMLGRTICGWLCPLGLIQELLHKIPTPKLRKNRVTHALSYLKYAILGIFVIGIPLVYSTQYFPVPGFCKYICPAGTLEGAMALLANPANADKFSMLGILFTRKFIIMVLILLTCVFVYRAFCRFLCPLGAIYGMFARLSLLGVKVEPTKCTHCGKCVATCQMDVKRVGDHECIHCGKCMASCPTNAISMKCGKITLMANETATTETQKKRSRKRERIAGCAALAVLAAALVYYNLPTQQATQAAQTSALTEATQREADDEPISAEADAAAEAVQAAEPVEDTTPIGMEVGMRCPTFTVPLYHDGGEFTLVYGKPTVINFWATWCTPCVAELPHFDKLYQTYGEQISIVALHSNMVTDDVQAFLDREELSLPFALDETGNVIKSLGGSTMLPMTVVLDRNGIIVYNKVGSVTYELLESLIVPLL